MSDKKIETSVKDYQEETIRLLKSLWKSEDRYMWKVIYTTIRSFAKRKGIE